MLTLVRTEATTDRTLGQLLANGEHFCHVLEDTLRPRGVKVAGVTAIPAGLYRVTLLRTREALVSWPSLTTWRTYHDPKSTCF